MRNTLPRIVQVVLILWTTTGALPSQQGATYRIDGQAGQRLGVSLTVCSDNALQPDGLPDIIVTTEDDKLCWYSVGSGTPVLVDFVTRNLGSSNTGTNSGFDIDGDGWDEVWVDYSVSAYRYGELLGGQYPHTSWGTFSNGECVAFAVGDLDGDGMQDLATTTIGYTSEVLRVRSGASIGVELLRLSDQDLGNQCAGMGDIDLDGFPDFAATAPSIATGQLRAIAGGPVGTAGRTIWVFYAQNPNDRLEAVVSMGDLDGDGIADIAVGSPGTDLPNQPDAGRVYFISGKQGLEIGRLDGFATGLGMGDDRRLAAGDLNGDGRSELIVGLPNFDGNGLSDNGAVRVYEWAAGGATLLRGHDGDNANDKFGSRVAYAGDLDGDGISDYAAAAPYADPAGQADGGSVFVFPGLSAGGPVLTAPPSATPGQVLSVAVSNAGLRTYVVLLGGPSSTGSTVFGHRLELGQPHFVLDVGGPVPLSGTLSLGFEVPDPFPVGLPFDLKLEALILDPAGAPYSSVDSTNLVVTTIR